MPLIDLLEHAARAAPDAPALITRERTLTFAGLLERARLLARALGMLAAPQARVAIVAENRNEYVEALYGVPAAGMRLVPLNHRLHPAEWAGLLERAGVTVLIGESRFLDVLEPLLAPLSRPPTRVLLDEAGGGKGAASTEGERGGSLSPGSTAEPRPTERWLAYETLLTEASSLTPYSPLTSDDDVAWLLSTSGTTGAPKLAMLTHRSLLAAVEACALARPIGPDGVYLFPFPLCHVAAHNVLAFHRHARPVVLTPRFQAGEVLEAIQRHRITHVSLAPTMLALLLEHPALPSADLSSLRLLAYGASGIPLELLRAAMTRLNVGFSQGYGMTELSGNVVFLGPDEHRRALREAPELLASAGRPAPGAILRIADEAGLEVPMGATGEILVRSDQVMGGYWEAPEATGRALQDGWLRTGDLGRFDAGGYLYVVDRLKDVIVTGGENVASREVEEVLYRHPAVREVAVVGAPDPVWGEIVCAMVVIRGNDRLEADELIEHCRRELASYKKPRLVLFMEELPRNAAGKIDKSRLRGEVQAHREVRQTAKCSP